MSGKGVSLEECQSIQVDTISRCMCWFSRLLFVAANIVSSKAKTGNVNSYQTQFFIKQLS